MACAKNYEDGDGNISDVSYESYESDTEQTPYDPRYSYGCKRNSPENILQINGDLETKDSSIVFRDIQSRRKIQLDGPFRWIYLNNKRFIVKDRGWIIKVQKWSSANCSSKCACVTEVAELANAKESGRVIGRIDMQFRDQSHLQTKKPSDDDEDDVDITISSLFEKNL